jgi:hypothetical protein
MRNAGMSAAFALFWPERLKQPEIALPYRASGYVEKGQALYNAWNSILDHPAEDSRLIDEWAVQLGMRGWYKWTKF